MPRKRVEFDWLNVLLSCGRSLSTSPIDVRAVCVSSAADTVVIGTTDSALGERMREPVMTMSSPGRTESSLLVSAIDAPAGASCRWQFSVTVSEHGGSVVV